MLCTRVDGHLIMQLYDLQSQTNKEDGYNALLFLRSLFANAENDRYKNDVLNNLKEVKLYPSESVFDFNKRFSSLY